MEKKYFTLEEANALLPVLRQNLTALQEIKQSFDSKMVELDQMNKKLLLGNPLLRAKDHIFKLECEIEFLQMEAQAAAKGFRRQGVLLKDIDSGLIDFPAMRQGEEVLWCWKLGEAEITHYHTPEDGYFERKTLED